MTLKKQLLNIVPLVLLLCGLFAYNFMSAQWTGPSGAAPSNNVSAPLNVGTTSQTKNGVLNANSLYGTGGVVANDIGIGTCALYGACPYPYETIQLNTGHNLRVNFATNQRLQLTDAGVLSLQGASQVNASQYCDAAGGNCFGPSSVSGGGALKQHAWGVFNGGTLRYQQGVVSVVQSGTAWVVTLSSAPTGDTNYIITGEIGSNAQGLFSPISPTSFSVQARSSNLNNFLAGAFTFIMWDPT